MRAIIIIGLIVVAVYFVSGGGFGTDSIFGPPDELPLSRYNDVDVNVYFYFESGQEKFLGKTKGASSCGSMARGFARSENVASSDWGYVCCTIEGGSDCYRKIR